MIQKKHLRLTAFVALCGFGCQNQPVNESMATDSPTNQLPVENTEAFTRIPLSIKKICNTAAGQSCLQEVQQLEFKLMNLNIIPVPKQGATASLSVDQATERYKDFLVAHKGEPIASVFRQVYASAILNRYGVIDSKNYELIKYYTRELTDENSMDFATLARAASVLQGKLAPDAYANLVNTTTDRAQEQEKSIQKQVDQLALTTRQKPATGGDTREIIAAKLMLTRLNKSTLRSDIQQLNKLQVEVSR